MISEDLIMINDSHDISRSSRPFRALYDSVVLRLARRRVRRNQGNRFSCLAQKVAVLETPTPASVGPHLPESAQSMYRDALVSCPSRNGSVSGRCTLTPTSFWILLPFLVRINTDVRKLLRA